MAGTKGGRTFRLGEAENLMMLLFMFGRLVNHDVTLPPDEPAASAYRFLIRLDRLPDPRFLLEGCFYPRHILMEKLFWWRNEP